MSGPTPRGATTAGDVAALVPLEAEAVRLFRLWRTGPEGRDRVTTDIAGRLAPADAERAVEALSAICILLVWQGRRPIQWRPPGAATLCADEACLAAFVADAGEGRRSDAMLMACLLARPQVAADLTDAAEVLGATLRRIAGAGSEVADLPP